MVSFTYNGHSLKSGPETRDPGPETWDRDPGTRDSGP